MFYADLIVGETTHMAIGFDTGVSVNWLNTEGSYKVINSYTIDSSNTFTGDTYDNTYQLSEMYNSIHDNSGELMNGKISFSDISDPIDFVFLSMDGAAVAEWQDSGSVANNGFEYETY